MAQTAALKTQQMQIGGMDCSSCEIKIETALQKLIGVAEVAVDVATERMTVSYDPQQIGEKAIGDRVVSLGYNIVTDKPKAFAQNNDDPDHRDGHNHHNGHAHRYQEHRHEEDGHNPSRSGGKLN